MRYILAIATLAVASVSAVLAETVTFESDDSILIVRGRDMYGSAVFELVANGDAPIQWIALDMSGKPLAVATTIPAMGQVIFPDLDVESVDRVACRVP